MPTQEHTRSYMNLILYICIWIVGIDPPMKVDSRTPFPDTFVRDNLKSEIMKTINLTQGKVALVDDADYKWFNQWRWYAAKEGENYFARRVVYTNGKGKTVQLHRLIMDVPKRQLMEWIDGNTLNCQRNNLVSYTHEQNIIKRTEKRKTLHCVFCGSNVRVTLSSIYGDYLCGNHRNHINRDGHILERTRKTPNPIVIKEDHAEIIIFNIKHQEKGRALIDIEDVELVENYKWHIDGNGAVVSHDVGYLHRFVLHAIDLTKEVDHQNRKPFDCQKHNLREITHSLNIHNSKGWSHNTSGTTGVQWNKKRGKWKARIKINYKDITLGMFKDIQDAINARKKAENELLPISIYPR